MILLITSYEADWYAIALRKPEKINVNNTFENQKQLTYNYKPRELVTQERDGKNNSELGKIKKMTL